MVERKLSFKLYIFAFILTVVVFLIGVYVGSVVDLKASEDLMNRVNYYYQDSTSFEIMFLLEKSSSFCPLYVDELSSLEQKTIDLGAELTYLEDVKGVFDPELKKQYFLLETKAFLLSEKTKELCTLERTNILYFYSDDCSECEKQAEELTDFSDSNKEIRIYSFDGSLESSVVQSLESKYNISEYPSLVINEETFSGLQTKQELLNNLY